MSNYKRGYFETSDGYYAVSRGGKAIRQHREIMESSLGRKLSPKEHVHHKNGDKLDNRVDNLEVVGIKEHGSWSGKRSLGIPKHGSRLIKEEQRSEFEDMYFKGTTWQHMANHFGVCVDTIQRYKNIWGLKRQRPARKDSSYYGRKVLSKQGA